MFPAFLIVLASGRNSRQIQSRLTPAVDEVSVEVPVDLLYKYMRSPVVGRPQVNTLRRPDARKGASRIKGLHAGGETWYFQFFGDAVAGPG